MLDEPDIRDIAGEVKTSLKVMYSYGPLHMAEQRQNNQRGGERGSGISVLMAWHDDDDAFFSKYFQKSQLYYWKKLCFH